MKKLLVIGHTFPEPSTTAAGGRMMQLLELFLEEGYSIAFASTANASERSMDLTTLGISTKTIKLNDSSFDKFILQLKPKVVIFDRYITEEQFGWRVADNCPEALRILDTEDLHFLRNAREDAIKRNQSVSEVNLFTESAKRELASIWRTDLSLIISEFELELLQNTFKIPSEILHYLPFLVEKRLKRDQKARKYEKRAHFVTMGNLLHKPNIDAVINLKKEIWPSIKKQLPKSELHIYGAYASQQIRQLHNKKEGFLIEGWVEDASEVIQNARVFLAPLRFGAGLKGKLVNAMLGGTPSVTTKIGAEGMHGKLPFSGEVKDDPLAFAKASVELYTNKEKWLLAQEAGFRIINERFQKDIFSEAFKKKIEFLCTNLIRHRKENFTGQLFQHQSLQASKYMSKWIEAKNK